MKNYLIAILSIFLISCEDDRTRYPNDISGTWTLTKVTSHESGSEEIIQIPEEQILWTFDTTSGTLSVANISNTPNLPLPSGNYPVSFYEFGFFNYPKSLTVSDTLHWGYDHSGLHLQITDGRPNGAHYDLIRPIEDE